jgi:hypothetical protein
MVEEKKKRPRRKLGASPEDRANIVKRGGKDSKGVIDTPRKSAISSQGDSLGISSVSGGGSSLSFGGAISASANEAKKENPVVLKHKADVKKLMDRVADDIRWRGEAHDDSKLEEPEKSIFDKVSPKLKGMAYSVEPDSEYQKMLKEMKPATDHHYSANDHHPEHYKGGIGEMSMVALLELMLDWCAASSQGKDGCIFKSIKMNKERFKYGDEIENLMINTARYLGYEPKPEE